MPLFAYTCNVCGVESELLIRGSETPRCPACDGADLEKQLSHIRPMSSSTPEPTACGTSQCPAMQGGGCCMN
ncbi:MAG: zinc ribbon domain-containing protein [Candidatus Hydrogenedentes bacterium]|nr:zinc ribbon domain-containing protein [Candidatus Hydrogenedentota bacterium]